MCGTVRQRLVLGLTHACGKRLCTGAKNREHIYEAFEAIYPVLQQFRKGESQPVAALAGAAQQLRLSSPPQVHMPFSGMRRGWQGMGACNTSVHNEVLVSLWCGG